MTSLKIEGAELVKTGHSVKLGGKMTAEMETALKEHYTNEGWTQEPKSIMLSFVSPCGRWFRMYCRETSRCYYIDGNWTVNLRSSK